MGTVSSTNPGLANLLQTLSNVDSPLLSSQSTLSAIENSSPADIVKLSDAATQLQEVGAIFGDGSQTTPESLFNGSSTFSALEDALTSPSTSTTSSTSGATNPAIPTSQLPAYESSLQSAEADALLDPGPTSSSASSLFNVLA